MALPESVLAALKAGAEITWGYSPQKGRASVTTFRLARTNAARQVSAVFEKLANFDELVRRQISAQIYLEEGLALAAYREAPRVTGP